MKIPSNITAVIFDFDGILIDSMPIWYEAGRVFLKKKQIVSSDKWDDELIGMGLKEIVAYWQKNLGVQGKRGPLLQELREDFYEIIARKKRLELIKGAKKIIQKLSESKQLVVASGGHSQNKIREILQNFSVEQFFKYIITSDSVALGKPHPDVYFYAAECLGVSPQQCLVLEDSENGVKAGKAAGMLVYGINNNEKERRRLLDAGADKVFKSLEGISL